MAELHKDNHRLLRSGVVVVGEASDSENDDDNDIDNNNESASNSLINQQLNDVSIINDKRHSIDKTAANNISKQQQQCLDDHSNGTISNVNQSKYTNDFDIASSSSMLDDYAKANKFDSLLHVLLKENNKKLKQNIITTMCTPSATMQQSIGQLTRCLISTQRQIQASYTILHKTTLTQMNQLNTAFANLDIILDSNK